jgi:hypothetical protein
MRQPSVTPLESPLGSVAFTVTTITFPAVRRGTEKVQDRVSVLGGLFGKFGKS